MKLFEVKSPDLLQSGLWPAVEQNATPLWVDGREIAFRRGGVEAGLGVADFVDFGEEISAIGQAYVRRSKRIYAGGSNLLMFDDRLHTIGEGYQSGTWDFVVWGSWLLATNGVDKVQVWKDQDLAEDLSGPRFETAKLLAKRGPHLLALNTDRGENFVEWCSADDVELWEPSGLNTAGSVVLRDLDGPIVAKAALGDQLLLFSHDTATLLAYVGAPSVFGTRPAVNGIGAHGPRSVVSIGRAVFGWGPQGIWTTDGVSHSYIDDPAIRESLDVVPGREEEILAIHNEKMTRVEFHYPIETGRRWVGFNYKTKGWTWGDSGFLAGIERQVFQEPLVVDGTKVKMLNSGTADSWIESKPLDFSNPQVDLSARWKYVDVVRVLGEGLDGCEVYVGVRESIDGAVDWEGPLVITDGMVYPRREGVYFSLKFSGTGWLLGGFEVFGEISGRVL